MKIIVFTLFFLVAHAGFSQELTAEEAFRISADTKKPVLLVFSGSDWCAPCIKFEKKVLSEETFKAYASEHLVILKADFPQRKKLAEALRKQNDALAERYNPDGLFPHIVLVAPDKLSAVPLAFTNQTSAEFIAMINAHLSE